MPAEFVENYDVGELILETVGHQESAKVFDNVLKFKELLRQKHPDLYTEHFQYFEDFLIDYYTFLGANQEVEEVFSNFIEYPDRAYDEFLPSLKKVLFYQYCDLVDKVITRVHNIIDNSERLIGGAAIYLAVYKTNINLGHYYLKAEKTGHFDRKGLVESLIPFEFSIGEKALGALEKGFSQYNLAREDINRAFRKDRIEFLVTLKAIFLKEKLNKGFHFVLSGTLWDLIMQFWEEQSKGINKSIDNYFSLNLGSFEEYLSELKGDFLIDNTSEMVAALWGSVYIYDFLLSKGLISQITYDQFKQISKVLKGKVIAQFTSGLWNANFVHHWEKPDSISESEFEEEGKIFQKSFLLKRKDFSDLKGEISEELGRLGDLSDYIVNGGMSTNAPSVNPVRNEVKIKRNDPCPCGSGKKYKQCCGKSE